MNDEPWALAASTPSVTVASWCSWGSCGEAGAACGICHTACGEGKVGGSGRVGGQVGVRWCGQSLEAGDHVSACVEGRGRDAASLCALQSAGSSPRTTEVFNGLPARNGELGANGSIHRKPESLERAGAAAPEPEAARERSPSWAALALSIPKSARMGVNVGPLGPRDGSWIALA